MQAMSLYGLRTDVELGTNLAGTHSLADALEDFKFAISQDVERALIGAMAAAGKKVEDPRGEILADINVAIQHMPHGREQLIAALIFHQVPAGSSPQRSLCIERLIMHGDNQNVDSQMQSFDVLDKLEPILPGQGDIEQHQFGAQRAHCSQRLARIACFATDQEIPLLAYQLGHAASCERVVINNEDPMP